MEYFFSLIAFILVVILMPWAIAAGHAWGFVDHPDTVRKGHDYPTPRVGGLVVCGVALPLIAIQSNFHASLYVAFGIVLAMGAWDDRWGLNPWIKLIAQGIAACVVVLGTDAMMVHNLGNIFNTGSISLGPVAIPFSIVCLVLLINALNMIDGLDGLAAGLGCIALVFLGTSPIFIAALIGFLLYALRTPWRASSGVFLGDAGSMALGVFLAISAFSALADKSRVPITIAWILALPIMDAGAQIIRRVSQGHSPLRADRGHIHYRLMDLGLSHGQTVAILLCVSTACGAIGFLPIPEWVLATTWTITFIVYNGIILKFTKVSI